MFINCAAVYGAVIVVAVKHQSNVASNRDCVLKVTDTNTSSVGFVIILISDERVKLCKAV
jgi:hypothetical protein